MGAHELSALLWRERELLELLVFKLEVEQLLLTTGNARWLQHATREVEQVMEHLRSAGLARSVEVTAVAKEWGTSEDATLRDLVAAAPPGAWSDTFRAHHQAMQELAGQIGRLRDSNEQYLRSALRTTQETIAETGPDTGTYDARGSAPPSDRGARLVDRTL